MKEELKTSEEWQENCLVKVIDPDGWDRMNYQYSWYEEKITKREFEKRLMVSTLECANISNIWIAEDKIKEAISANNEKWIEKIERIINGADILMNCAVNNQEAEAYKITKESLELLLSQMKEGE